MLLDLSDIRAAAARIAPFVHRTPVLTSATLDACQPGSLFFKCENFQKLGAFKARGATNAVFLLDDGEARHGVATHSSGNHAAALAHAARLRGIPAYIVMPSNAPEAKVASVVRKGATIIRCEPTLAAREANAARVVAETGAVLIPPYDDFRVMAGQGTAALELLDDVPDIDILLTPVGGGGLLGGCAVAAKALRPNIRVIGCEPLLADDAARSLRAGTIQSLNPASGDTIADGLRVQFGAKALAVADSRVETIVCVSEVAIIEAMRTIWEVLKIVVEPSAAVPLAAVRSGAIRLSGERVGIILSGGNLDLETLPWSK